MPDSLFVLSGCLGLGEKITNRTSPTGRNSTEKCRFGTVRHCAQMFLSGDNTTSGYCKLGSICRKLTKFFNDSGRIATSSGYSSLEASKRNWIRNSTPGFDSATYQLFNKCRLRSRLSRALLQDQDAFLLLTRSFAVFYMTAEYSIDQAFCYNRREDGSYGKDRA